VHSTLLGPQGQSTGPPPHPLFHQGRQTQQQQHGPSCSSGSKLGRGVLLLQHPLPAQQPRAVAQQLHQELLAWAALGRMGGRSWRWQRRAGMSRGPSVGTQGESVLSDVYMCVWAPLHAEGQLTWCGRAPTVGADG
jgi:hypothetical protein